MSPFSMRWAVAGAALGLSTVATSCTPPGEQVVHKVPQECSRWEEGCPCDPDSKPVTCGEELETDGENVTCGSGTRSCVDGVWAACAITERHVGVVQQALVGGGPTKCSTCQPYCATVPSYPTVGGDLTGGNAFNIQINPAGGGITLAAAPVGGGTVCVGGGPGCVGFDLTIPDASGMLSTGLSLAANGNIILTNPDTTGSGSGSSLAGSVFVSNTADGTVSRYDYVTFKETGRWWTCPAMSSSCDPSRTSVNTRGDAFVANRAHKSVIRISNLGTSCRDTTGPMGVPDGQIKTWTNGGKPLPWVQVSGVWKPTDDCVAWYRDVSAIGVEPMVRGIAAQDLTDATTGELKEYVWVGSNSNSTNRVVLLDGATGNLLRSVVTPGGIYGMAMDRGQNLWMLAKGTATGALMRLDTTRCHASDCPALTWCASGAGLATNCDGEIAEKITVPGDKSGYGITVDFKQRVWLNEAKLTSYDRSLDRGASPYTGRFKTALATSGAGGVAADAKGWVWACGKKFILRVKADAPDVAGNSHTVLNSLGEPVKCGGKGIGTDTAGRIWAIPSTSIAGKCQTP